MRKFIKCNDDNPSTWKKENHILKRNPPSNLDETHIHQCPLLVKIGHVNLLGRFGIPSIPSIIMYLLLKGQTNPFINQPMGNGCATFSKRLMAWFIFSHLNSGRPSQCFNILEEYQMNYYVNLFGGIYMYIYIYLETQKP